MFRSGWRTAIAIATGAPLTTYAGFLAENFSYLASTPAILASSPGVVRSFCGRCGTPLTYQGLRWPGEVHVVVGTLDQPDMVTPSGEALALERLPWLPVTLPAATGSADR